MSLTRQPDRFLFNAITADTVTVAGGIVTIEGIAPFTVASVTACFRTCPVACVPQVITVTPTPPTSTCACPYEWTIEIRRSACLGTYRVQETFEMVEIYNYTSPTQTIPTQAEIAVSIAAQINSNPDSVVTATVVGGNTFTLTEKDCDSDKASCGFTAYIETGTIAVSGGSNAAHVDAVLPASEVGREWPILPGSMFGRPGLAYCGTYCVYRLTIDPVSRTKDPHLSNAMVDRFREIEIWVDSSLTNFQADWDTPLATAITCLGDPIA